MRIHVPVLIPLVWRLPSSDILLLSSQRNLSFLLVRCCPWSQMGSQHSISATTMNGTSTLQNSCHLNNCHFINMQDIISRTCLKLQSIPHLFTSQLQQQPVRYKFNVRLHEITIHADQVDWQSLCEEFLFNKHSFLDDALYTFRWRLVFQVFEH